MKKINIIISDYDNTLSTKNGLYPYLLILFNLKCSNMYETIFKYIKIICLPFFLIINLVIYIFDKNIALKILNYYMFRQIKKTTLDKTINIIKNDLNKYINKNILAHMNTLYIDHKYIISGNLPAIISKVLPEFTEAKISPAATS